MPTGPNEASCPDKDLFTQKAIEHWLDSANELAYQPLFCQWLASEGYSLKYAIKNTNFEQGKDVVAVDPDGIVHAYQLKGDNITLDRWRSEVKPEIEALIDCPIKYPGLGQTDHKSWLVTNGVLDDSVRVEITDLNSKKWKNSPLSVMVKGDLLSAFQGMAGGFFPEDAQMYKQICDLAYADGTGLPDLTEVNNFLSTVLKVAEGSVSKEQRKRGIATALLYSTIFAGVYRKAENHVAAVRIMVLLLSLIFYLADRHTLADKYWKEAYRIIWNDILATSKLLESEINEKGFDSAIVSLYDLALMPFRKYSVMSVIIPFKLSQSITGDEKWEAILLPETALRYKDSIAIWGEAALLLLIFWSFIFKNVEKDTAIDFLKNVLIDITHHNGRSKETVALPSPYYDESFGSKFALGLLEEEVEDNRKERSYLMKSVIDALVRLGQRDFIAKNWQEASFISLGEFIPDDVKDYYLWRIPRGENRITILKREKSWAELVEEAGQFNENMLPPLLKQHPEFLPFFLSVFPFRATPAALHFLDTSLNQKTS